MRLYQVESLDRDDQVLWKEVYRVKVGQGSKDAVRGRVPALLREHLRARGAGRYDITLTTPPTLSGRGRFNVGTLSPLGRLIVDDRNTISWECER